jgi:hypothetical protein
MDDKSKNKNLQKAKMMKKDEFYTQLDDIEKELKHYKSHFKDKVVYCNCDDPRVSNFFHYFSYNFEKLGLKKLITTCFKSQEVDLFSQNISERSIYLEYTGDKNGNRVPDINEIGINYLQGDGDFRSPESIELLKQSDIVVTNPPFSLFREYVAQLIKYNKKFIIIGSSNAISYKDLFKLIQDNKIWFGYNLVKKFTMPDTYEHTSVKMENGTRYAVFGNICWYTNLDIPKRHDNLIMYKTYKGNEGDYPKYVNYNAIEVSKVKEIPLDYKGEMGVPITFLDKYNPEQFEIVGSSMTLGTSMTEIAGKGNYVAGGPRFYMDNGDGTYQRLYDRIVIKNKKVQK